MNRTDEVNLPLAVKAGGAPDIVCGPGRVASAEPGRERRGNAMSEEDGIRTEDHGGMLLIHPDTDEDESEPVDITPRVLQEMAVWREKFCPGTPMQEFMEKWVAAGGDMRFPRDAEDLDDAFGRAVIGIPAWMARFILFS